MTEGPRTPPSSRRLPASADPATGCWAPDRGDLAYDLEQHRVGVVVALPEDTGTTIYHLRPEGGGEGWPAPLGRLSKRVDTHETARSDEGVTLTAPEVPAVTAIGTHSDGQAREPSYAIDFTTITYTVDQALAIRIALPERAWTDSTTHKLRGHLGALLDDEIWDVETPQSRMLIDEARKLLREDMHPTKTTPPGFAYEYMRKLALATRKAAAVYRLRLVDRERERPTAGGKR
ncbi:hypothetical protein ACWCXE_12770 [Streptomyces sp. NPDC001780]